MVVLGFHFHLTTEIIREGIFFDTLKNVKY